MVLWSASLLKYTCWENAQCTPLLCCSFSCKGSCFSAVIANGGRWRLAWYWWHLDPTVWHTLLFMEWYHGVGVSTSMWLKPWKNQSFQHSLWPCRHGRRMVKRLVDLGKGSARCWLVLKGGGGGGLFFCVVVLCGERFFVFVIMNRVKSFSFFFFFFFFFTIKFDFRFEKERKWEKEKNERGRDREGRLRSASPKSLNLRFVGLEPSST